MRIGARRRTEDVFPLELIQVWGSVRDQRCSSRRWHVEHEPAQQLVPEGNDRGPHGVVKQFPLACTRGREGMREKWLG